MRYIQEIMANRVLWVCVLSWFAAQGMKVVFTAIFDRRLDFSRLFGLGGMPSSHSSVMTSLATAIGISRGFYSVEFAISTILAFIVMTDATGVRRAAGKQAKVLNSVVQDLIAMGKSPTSEKLKELLGHTPFEVVIGALLGILIAFLFM